MAMEEVVQDAERSFVKAAAVHQVRLGVHAINRLGSAPPSGMGSGEQSAAKEGKEGGGRLRHQAKTLSTRPRADRLRLTLSSICNTILKRTDRAFGTLSLCSRSFIRVHNTLPGLSGARRNTRGCHCVIRARSQQRLDPSSPAADLS